MITEKGRPLQNGPDLKTPGQQSTGIWTGQSNVCAGCGMPGTVGSPGHAHCANAALDASAFANVPSTSTADGTADSEVRRSLNIARSLIGAGVPVFAAPPDPSHPAGFRLPSGWPETAPDTAQVDKWRPGWALCAVAGHAVDVLDTDPRNGGDVSARQLRDAGMWPTVYGTAETPSGGTHDLIAPLRCGKGVPAEGVDLQGGKQDGTGRGFVFIAPTVRKSKVDGVPRAYRWTAEPDLDRLAADGAADGSGRPLAALITGKRSPSPAVQDPGVEDLFSSSATSRSVGLDQHVRDLCNELARAPEGQGNDTAARIAYMLGQYVGAGQLSTQNAARELMSAVAGWRWTQPGDKNAMWATIVRQVAEGSRNPRAWDQPYGNYGGGSAFQDFTTPDQQPEQRRIDMLRERMRSRLHNRDTLDTIEPPTPLIDGVLDKGTIALLSGKFGTYKTFVSLAWACSIATGQAWEGLEVVTPGPVLYVAGEGCSGLRARVRAWEIGQYGGRRIAADRLAVLNGRVKLTDADEMLVLGEFIRELRPVLVVFDTLHQCAPGMDENSSKDMGTVLGAVAELRERFGVTALLNHHTGHSGDRARGSSALEDDVDTSWVINLADAESRAAENQRTLKHRKAKDRELLADRPILLRPVPESGSAFVESGTVTPSSLLPDGFAALRVMGQLDDLGVPRTAGRPACRKALNGAGHSARDDVLSEAVRRRKDAARREQD